MGESGAPVPAGFGQRFMAAGKREHPNPGWNMLLPWRLTGRLDRAALLGGIDAVVERHEVLRTTVGDGPGGRPVQVVHPHRTVEIPEVDLRGRTDADCGSTLDRLARERHALALDHTRGPLIAGTLVRAADEEAYLLLTVDHSACDGWSIGVILAELTAFYNGTVTGRGARLWPLPGQYRDFALAQHRTAGTGGYAEQLAFWADRLAPRPAPLGLAYQRSDVDGYRSGQHPVLIEAAVAHRLRALGRRGRTTLFMTLLTGLAAALARRTEHGDVAVTSLVAGRRQVEHQRLVGMFANPVVLRTATAGAGTFAALAERVRRGVLEAYGRQDVPFPLVAERTGVRAAEVWLNVAPPPALARFRDLAVDTRALPRDYPIDVPAEAWRGEKLICNLADTGGQIVGLLDYNRNQLDADTVRVIADDLLAILAAAAADPDTPLPPAGDRPPF